MPGIPAAMWQISSSVLDLSEWNNLVDIKECNNFWHMPLFIDISVAENGHSTVMETDNELGQSAAPVGLETDPSHDGIFYFSVSKTAWN